MSQYWNAWTKVMLRIPPLPTLTTTTTPTTTAPTHSRSVGGSVRVSPAPWNCGSR